MKHTVLIVDDTEINLILFEALIRKVGDCESVKFTRSVDALAWAQVNDLDLAIVDYMMPEMDGIEFVRRLTQTPGKESTPIVMITANDQNRFAIARWMPGLQIFWPSRWTKLNFWRG